MINKEITFNSTIDDNLNFQYNYLSKTNFNTSYEAYIKLTNGIIKDITFNISNEQYGNIL